MLVDRASDAVILLKSINHENMFFMVDFIILVFCNILHYPVTLMIEKMATA